MVTVEFEYAMRSEVRIKNLDTKGIVVGFYIGDNGIQYQVAYFLNGERKVQYLYLEELGPVESGTKVGFISK